MFVKVYLSAILVLFAASLAGFGVYQIANDWREDQYESQLVLGMLRVARDGYQRQSQAKQGEWLSLVSQITGTPFKVVSKSVTRDGEDELLVESLETGIGVFLPLENKNGQPTKQYLKANFDTFDERHLRVAALLTMLDIRQTPPVEQPRKLERLSALYGFRVSIVDGASLSLDAFKKARLERGNVIVNTSLDRDNEISVYVKPNLSAEQAVKIGPITGFDENPTWLLLSIIFGTATLAGVGIFVAVRKVERRINRLSDWATSLGSGDFSREAPEQGNDSISDLAASLQTMSSDIDNLLGEQRHIMQAVSHDLRTPISRIKFRLDAISLLTEAPEIDGALVNERLLGIHKDIAEIHGLIDETLFYHQLDAHQLKENARKKDQLIIRPLIESVVQDAQLIYSKVQFLLESDAEIMLMGTEHLVKRLILNLIQNAAQHAKSMVSISVQQDADRTCMIISDDGPGIPEHLRESVLKAYSRVDTSRNKKEGGYGLGLAIVERIVAHHGWQISIGDSKQGGAAFTIVMPR